MVHAIFIITNKFSIENARLALKLLPPWSGRLRGDPADRTWRCEMRMMMMMAILTTVAALSAPARAQVGAAPSVTRAQFGTSVLPCVEKPMPEPELGVGRPPFDAGCERVPSDPPAVKPDPVPCLDGGCGDSSRRQPRPNPCWWDDCRNGGGLARRYGIEKETLNEGKSAAKQEVLNSLFDNMSVKASNEGAVYAGRSAAAPIAAAASFSADSGASARRVVGFVPAPEMSAETSRRGPSWGLFGAGMLALSGLLLSRGKGPRVVLASGSGDEHTDPNSARNNPQHDGDVERGWKDDQARRRDAETVRNSSGTVTNGDNYTGGNSLPPSNNGGGAARPPRWTPPMRPVGR
ncbi:MAG: hypothetical protein KGJ84_13505 [Elusimicrobia bacterium]|nr:hypothetical protein [Elusimicrobiota bacterium]